MIFPLYIQRQNTHHISSQPMSSMALSILFTSTRLPRLLLLLLLLATFFQSTVSQTTPNAEERANQAFFLLLRFGAGRRTLETPIQARATFFINLANYNAWCNYHPTAVDIFGRSRFRRPVEDHTLENKNVAAFFSMLRLIESSPESFGSPSAVPGIRGFMKGRGLDPDDESVDTSTNTGLGNRVGFETARLMAMDGWNANGSLTSSQPNYVQPFADYTEYVPKNNPWKIKFPFRWQPFLENSGYGFFFRQEHIVPQAGSGITFSISPAAIRQRRVQSPYKNVNANARNAKPRDIAKLKRFARKVFKTSARLTEKQRILAEFFDGKIASFETESGFVRGLAAAVRFRLLPLELDFNADDDVFFGLGATMTGYESIVTSWNAKRAVDGIRPTGQTMEFLFGEEKFEVWGGPGKENVLIKAGEWLPYIRTMPHSEFPSASACLCLTMVEHALETTKGKDDIPYTVVIPKGSSKFYPGQVPAEDFTLTIDKLSDWTGLCGVSRLYAGVHFEGSIEAGYKLCRGMGIKAHKFVEDLVAGNPDLSWVEQFSEKDRFWEY